MTIIGVQSSINLFNAYLQISAPNNAPDGVSVAAINQTCVNVAWTVAPSEDNGPITKYEVSQLGLRNTLCKVTSS